MSTQLAPTQKRLQTFANMSSECAIHTDHACLLEVSANVFIDRVSLHNDDLILMHQLEQDVAGDYRCLVACTQHQGNATRRLHTPSLCPVQPALQVHNTRMKRRHVANTTTERSCTHCTRSSTLLPVCRVSSRTPAFVAVQQLCRTTRVSCIGEVHCSRSPTPTAMHLL